MRIISLIICLVLSTFLDLQCQSNSPYILTLGIVQDGGYPHLACEKNCCDRVWKDASRKRFVVSLALVDPVENKWWLLEATPDLREQLQLFRKLTKGIYSYLPAGIFITHAHIGHYSGLMQFGREVMNTNELPVYVMPRMKQFLENNGPWSQLVDLKNIKLNQLTEGFPFQLNHSIQIDAIAVPHRDEFSETVCFKIITKQKSYLFIPDIDKWGTWNQDIIMMVKKVDIAFIDATFYEINELKNRRIEDVPHPFVIETMNYFEKETAATRSKVVFIHFNHTNPLLWSKGTRKEVLRKGFRVAEQSSRY